jgi:uncharacterized integral membrane protein (TIGR00698 family)
VLGQSRIPSASGVCFFTTDEKEQKAKEDPSVLQGVALAATTAVGGFSAASVLSSLLSVPVSGIPCSILLGMAVRNTLNYDQDRFKPGITFATKTILQTGIVCVAAKLSFWELFTAGFTGIPVTAGLLFLPVASAWAGLPQRMGLLLAAGTSICGVTAITALAPAIQAENRDIAVAVANTVAFGTLGMLAYPYIFHYACHSSEMVGMCLGVAIHDTSQVLGSALAYKETFGDEIAFKTAAITKLSRNLGLAVAIPALTYQYNKLQIKQNDGEIESSSERKPETLSGLSTFTKYVPPFLVAFLGMSAFRTTGDILLTDISIYTSAMDWIGNDVSKYALGTAMAGVGLSTSVSSLKGVGWKPFAVGGAGALVVGGTGFAVASLLV